MIYAVGDILSPQEIIDRQVDGAYLGASKPRQDVVNRVMSQYGDTVVLLYTQRRERVGCPVALVFKLGIGERLILEDQGLLVRIVVAAAPDHVCNNPPVNPVVPIHQEFDILLIQGVVPCLFLVRQRFPVICHTLFPPFFPDPL